VHEEAMLNRCAELVQIEVELAEGLRRPKSVELVWIWPRRPHVDPYKEPAGEAQEMANGTLPFSEACARRGRDPQKVVRQHARDRKMFEDAGVPLPASLAGGMPTPPEDDPAEEEGGGSQGGNGSGNGSGSGSGDGKGKTGAAKVVKVGGKK
jgi:capsid protein